MDLGIAGRTALVTGAGRGIGAAICKSLASEGVRVAACSRTGSDLQSLMESLPGAGHVAFSADLQSSDAASHVMSEIQSRDLVIDILVNNVGGTLGIDDPLAPSADFAAVWHLNFGLAVDLNRHLIPGMQERTWGRICHVSSIAALENQGPPAYCAAKAALNAYVRSVGRYVSPEGVILTGIMPGAVYTEGGYWEQASIERPEHVRNYLDTRMASRRFGTEREISEAVCFLVSKHASFMVGSNLLVDGGQGRAFYPSIDL